MDSRNSPVTVTDRYIEFLNSIKEREHLIEAALEYSGGTHSLADIVNMIMAGRVQFLPLPNSFMVTEIIEYPQVKHLNIFLAGGDLQELKNERPNVINMAKAAGCSALVLSGRRGWVKALADIGWKEMHTRVWYPITSEN